MDTKQAIKQLIKKAKASDMTLSKEELIFYAPEGTDDYDLIFDAMIDAEVSIIEDDDVLDIEDLDEDLADLDAVEFDELSLSTIEVEEIKQEELLDVESVPANIRVDDPVRMYLKEIGQIPLIDAEQEVDYAIRVSNGKMAQQQLNEFREAGITIPDADRVQLEQMIEDGLIAKHKLVEANYRLVVSIAKRHVGRGMQFLDLIQEGNMGLMKAVDKFDHEKGFKFSTYATWWIRQAITRSVADQARTIRIPVHMVETINKLGRIQRQLVQDLSREPTVEEIAEAAGFTPEEVQRIQKIAQEPISLEAPVGEEEDSNLGDFISDPNALNPHDYTIREMVNQAIDEVLATLTDREEKVIRLRYGLLDGKTHTLEEVGREFGVTRERIRQIEGKALRKLRQPSRQKKLRDFNLHR